MNKNNKLNLFIVLLLLNTPFSIAANQKPEPCKKQENQMECRWLINIQNGATTSLDLFLGPDITERVKKKFKSQNLTIRTKDIQKRELWFQKIYKWYNKEKLKTLQNNLQSSSNTPLSRYIQEFPEDWKEFTNELKLRSVKKSLRKNETDTPEIALTSSFLETCGIYISPPFLDILNLGDEISRIEFITQSQNKTTKMGAKIIKAAKKMTKSSNPGGYCLRGVEFILKEALGAKFPFTGNDYAKMTTNTFRTRVPYKQLFREVKISKKDFDQRKLPDGAILVWDHPSRPGHIEIYSQKDHTTYSDFINPSPNYYVYGAPTVFIPQD